MKRDNTQLTEADYDFSDVADGIELESCFFYEYARESSAFAREVAAARRQITQSKGKSGEVKFGSRVQNQVQSFLLMSLTLAKGFPHTPWRTLSDKDRQHILKYLSQVPHIWRYATTWHNPPLTFSMKEPEAMSLEMWKKQCRERLPSVPDTDPIKSGFFAINLKYGRGILIEQFARWLTHFEGKAMSETPPIETELAAPKKLPGRKSIHDKLNALAAMRLRYHCNTFTEAQKLIQGLKDKPNGMFYERRDGANRACNLALRHFKHLFGWLDPAKPIHFTESWRGGLKN